MTTPKDTVAPSTETISNASGRNEVTSPHSSSVNGMSVSSGGSLGQSAGFSTERPTTYRT